MLIGRAQERVRLGRLLDDALEGRAGALVLVGEAGIGKTALLKEAMQDGAARGMSTRYAGAVEAEQTLPGAGLSLLAARGSDLLPRLSRAHRAALEDAARGRVDDVAPAATLSLLAAMAAEGPTVLAIDDLPWWDPPSRRALLFAVRRLAADAVAVVLAGRPEVLEDPAVATLEVVEVTPLGDADAATLLRSCAPGIAARQVAELLDRLAGNPLALVETARALPDDVVSGTRPLPNALPVGAAVAARWGGRISALGEPTRRALLLLACGGTARDGAHEEALASVGLTAGDLVPAEAAGLIDLGPEGPGWRHPLVRAAVLAAAAPGDVRGMHALLAASVDGDGRPLEQALHLAASVAAPDAAVAEQLAARSRDLVDEGALPGGVAVAVLAARLTPDPAVRAERLATAGALALADQQDEHAADLAKEGLTLDPEPRVRGECLRVLGIATGLTRDVRVGRALLRESMSLLAGPARDRAVLDAVSLAGFDCSPADALDLLDRYPPDLDDPQALLLSGDALCLAGRWAEGVPRLRSGLARVDPDGGAWTAVDDEAWFNACVTLSFDEVQEEMSRVTAALLASGAPARALLGVLNDVFVHFFAGEWEMALDRIDEARHLHDALGRVDFYSDAQAGEILARRGDSAAFEPVAHRAEAVVTATGNDLWRSALPGQRALLHLAHGELELAVPLLEASVAAMPAGAQAQGSTTEHAVLLVEALARLDRPAEAREVAQRLAAALQGAPGTLARAWVARSAAALAGDGADPLYREAVEAIRPEVHAFARAHTQLLWGESLRLRRRRRDACGPLSDALTGFEQLGCGPWAQRCREELAAAGAEVPLGAQAGPLSALTPQERRVARAAASGQSNAEVARQIFLSPKTVEVHLTHVYRKLGISGRDGLARALEAAEL